MTRVQLNPDGLAPTLDRYQLVGVISSGGMGIVSLGRLAGVGGFQRLVAIKQLHPHLSREQEFVEMFLDEARLAAGIHHQNVVSILEVGTSESGYYLVMEYIEGASLAEVEYRCSLRTRRVPNGVMLRVLLDTLAGLHAAHELKDDYGQPLGLVHRDCSPQNILLGLDGCAKITDFGIARASARLANTREGAFKGKLSFMAPEQTQGENIDRRADLFSVGVMLWESLADRRLFKAPSEAQTLNNLLNMPIPSLRDIDPEIHPQLDAVCAKALNRDPALRFQTAEEMAEALERAARSSAQAGQEALASVRELAAFVAEVLGDEITSQRESVRSWLTKSGNTPAVISSSKPSSRVPPQPVSDRPPATSRNWPVATADPAPPPRPTERGWPPTPSGESGVHSMPRPLDSQEEQTLVHLEQPDPVIDAREYPAVPDELATVPRTHRSLGMERRWRWPVVGASLAVLGVGATIVLASAWLWGNGQSAAAPAGTASAPRAGTARELATSDLPAASSPAHVTPTSDAPSTTATGTSSPSAPATSTHAGPPAEGVPPPTAATVHGARPTPSATAAVPATATARPKATATPGGGDDDLTNPYHK